MTKSKNHAVSQKVLEDWLRLPERQELFAGLILTVLTFFYDPCDQFDHPATMLLTILKILVTILHLVTIINIRLEVLTIHTIHMLMLTIMTILGTVLTIQISFPVIIQTVLLTILY